MRWLILAACLMALGFVSNTQLFAEDKPSERIDGKQLLGKWEGKPVLIDSKDGKTVIEFVATGVIKLKTNTGPVSWNNEGKYTLEGNTLTIITLLDGGKEDKSVATVTKLTASELEWRNSAGKTETFKRIKEEEKK